MPSPSTDLPTSPPLAGEIVVFTGKLGSLGRREAHALVARLGGTTADEVNLRTTMLVVGAEGRGLEKSQKLRRAEELNAQGGAPIRILEEGEFCHLVGVPAPEALRRQYHSMRDILTRYRTLREDHLRYFVKCGVIRPVLRTNADTYFAFPDLACIKQASDELARGASFQSVVRGLMASRHGQLTLDFHLEASPAKILTLHRPPDRQAPGVPPAPAPDTARAEDFRIASSLDDGDEGRSERAAGAYRQALACDPSLVPALINLANIHYSHDQLAEAQALYERAIALEPDFFEAHFNLGNIFHDLGRLGDALVCYREALRLNPGYPEGHFYLAVTLEKLGRSQDALPHWRQYRQLAPQGEWVALAREFSE